MSPLQWGAVTINLFNGNALLICWPHHTGIKVKSQVQFEIAPTKLHPRRLYIKSPVLIGFGSCRAFEMKETSESSWSELFCLETEN